jgi:3-hydroxyacyl-CoA dehydrogenase/enoyl-CoA hydratase/carnithine racemase
VSTDTKTVKVETRDGVAVVTLDNPPVNQLTDHFARALFTTIIDAFGDEGVQALVITGTGKNFIAGADITQLQKATDREQIKNVALVAARTMHQFEIGPKPIVCAINGNCLGGGLEFAMACHYRLAAPGLNLGQPEVQIGLIPGAGGTQRLPRLIGLPNAIEMITVGRPIKSELARSRGLIDEVVPADQLVDKAVEAARRFISGELKLDARRTRNRFTRLPSAAEKTYVSNGVRFMTYQKAKDHYPAPYKAIDAIDHGLSFDIETDVDREVDYFADCAVTDVCKNLINIFLGSRSAGRLPRIKGIEPAKIKKVAMLGGGVMGSGIVNLLLANGFEAVLWDINDAALDKGLAAVRKTFDFPIKKKKMKPADLEQMIEGRLTLTTDLAGCADVDLVIEAVLEDMSVKQDIWKKLEGICRPDVVFATNTSALPITEMASVLDDPGRMIGLHFFNPAHRMQLLEIICAEKTSDQTLATSVAFGRAIKKIPIVVNDGPGFYVSRQLGGLMGGSVFLVAAGVDGGQIEKAMVDFGMPMGPATLADLTGIDINFHVNTTFERTLGERYAVHPLTEAIYNVGDYGRKTGRGYFDYTDPKKPAPNPRVAEAVQKYLADNNIEPRKVSDQEIVDAMLACAINEAAYMIQEGICDRPLDMDLAMIYGTGFPPYRGGILAYADKWGVKNVHDKLLDLEKIYGPRFRPAELLQNMAQGNQTFYQS